VTLHGRPVADIVPAGSSRVDEGLRELIAEGRIAPAARPRPPRPPRPVQCGRSASEIVLAEREDDR
jgi:antitoxin (DNA-binding transcriptional repressor) of toxin-antitoxin stability system